MMFVLKKKNGSGAIGYAILFIMVMLMVMVSMFMIEEAKLMTHQHDIDDALANSVLASLVADDTYYFDTLKDDEEGILRFRDIEQSHTDYKECMETAIGNTNGFYYNFEYTTFILYEVKGNNVKAVTYTGNKGKRVVSNGVLGEVKTPKGTVVKETSAYAKVSFDIKSIMTGKMIRKSRDIYCALKVNKLK